MVILRYNKLHFVLDTNVRLVGGFTKYEGRLEVYYNGTWGTVDGYYINSMDMNHKFAAVVCRSLGLPW